MRAMQPGMFGEVVLIAHSQAPWQAPWREKVWANRCRCKVDVQVCVRAPTYGVILVTTS